ncbi:GNAT family N-acetyltransferase [uncultured Cellulomonas sp.]|uniref:GNAT family N-acetyltransferase n=1 Tax=uncultured Cellulomonas sp. TaxID=189682 RepID=UPI0028EDEF2E|nr:GNAT family N-acetyltransferase [uncultured Cellulomonas sp.]
MAPVSPRPASAADVDAIHALRRSLEDWMAATGTVQWPRGSLPRERIAAQVAAGEWHVVADDDLDVLATVRLLWSDPDFWGADRTPAVYVHGLMVDRRAAGRGLGSALLDWAAQRGRDAGVEVLRLDCRTTNPVLRRYYEAYGFRAVGQVEFATFSCTLLELSLRVGGRA